MPHYLHRTDKKVYSYPAPIGKYSLARLPEAILPEILAHILHFAS